MTKPKIVFLTGAGISQESNIPTFRDSKDGLWEHHKIEDVASRAGFYKNPKLVHDFYNQRRLNVKEAVPNAAHLAIAALEEKYEVVIITQNVDDLHERAGSNKENIIHLHGSLFSMICKGKEHSCGHEFSFYEEWTHGRPCPSCGRTGSVRPKIVWFGESLDTNDYSWAVYHCETADLFVQVGTSAEVAPANILIHNVPFDRRVEINLESSDTYKGPTEFESEWRDPVSNKKTFSHYFLGKATEQVPLFASKLDDIIANLPKKRSRYTV